MKYVCLVVQNVYDIDPRVRRKAEALVSAGYSVDVLALRASNGNKSYVLNGVNVYTISLGKRRGSQLRYIYEYGAFFMWSLIRLPMLMLRRRYAVIDVNSLPDVLIFAALVARWMGAKLVLDLHEITPEFYMSKYGIAENSRTIRLLTYLEKISINFADHVLTINEPIEDLLVRRGMARSKSTVVMNAVDQARFEASSSAPPEAASRDRDKFVMMYHGTLTSIYGLDLAIEAFAQAHTEMPYWSSVFRDPAVGRTSVPVRYDPYDAGTAFAYIGNRWVACYSEHFSSFHGRSEREMMIAAAELHKRYRDHSRQFKLTARRLADFVASAESEESLLVQRLQDAAARRIHLDSGEPGDRCENGAARQGESEPQSEPELASLETP